MKQTMTALRVSALTAVIAFGATGCATKHYGRQGTLTAFERDTMTCREIDLEIAKVNGFVAKVEQESSFDVKDVLAILGDFGIGNAMESEAAFKSADERMGLLTAERSAKRCVGESPAVSRAIVRSTAEPAYK